MLVNPINPSVSPQFCAKLSLRHNHTSRVLEPSVKDLECAKLVEKDGYFQIKVGKDSFLYKTEQAIEDAKKYAQEHPDQRNGLYIRVKKHQYVYKSEQEYKEACKAAFTPDKKDNGIDIRVGNEIVHKTEEENRAAFGKAWEEIAVPFLKEQAELHKKESL